MPENTSQPRNDSSFHSKMKENLEKIRKDIADGQTSSARLSINNFVQQDTTAQYKNDIHDIVNMYLDTFDATETYYLISKSLLPAARHEDYTTMAAQHLVSLAYYKELDLAKKIDSAYTASEHLSPQSAACEMAVHLLLKLSKEEETGPIASFAIARHGLLNSGNAPDLQKNGFKLWEKFLNAVGNISKLDETRLLAKGLSNDSPVQEKVFALWTEELDKHYKGKEYPRVLSHLSDAITHEKMPDTFTEHALKRWTAWRKAADGDFTQKANFLRVGVKLAEKFYNTDPEKKKSSPLREALTQFKEALTRDLLEQYPYRPDQKLGEEALLEAARYEGDDKTLRREIINKLEALERQNKTLATRASERAAYYIKTHKEYLGIPDQEADQKAKNKNSKTDNKDDNGQKGPGPDPKTGNKGKGPNASPPPPKP